MRLSRWAIQLICWLLLMTGPAFALSNAELISGEPREAPVPGMATMVDFGAKSCVPCKMMAPVLRDMAEAYEGKAAVMFIDVWKTPEARKPFDIKVIPTQIFFDKDGREVWRHRGYLGEEQIVEMFAKLGVVR